MKTTQSPGIRPDHQTVAGTFEFKSNGKAIALAFTEPRLSPPAGSATLWGWLRPLDWGQRLAAALPHPRPRSNNKLLPLEKALAFMPGLLCDARKLTHIAYLRRDPLAPELLGIKRIARQSVLTRFFQGFPSAGQNLRCFRPLWRWWVGFGCPAPKTVPRWTWIRPGCCTKTDGRRAGSAVTPSRDSSRAGTRGWRSRPRCAWGRNCGCAPATPPAAADSPMR